MGTPAQRCRRLADRDLAGDAPTALSLLLHAYDCARALGCSLWDFAVEIQSFQAAGLTTTDLRWLLHRGYAEHATEATRSGDRRRRFRSRGSCAFNARSCLVLQDDKVSAVRALCPAPRPGGPDTRPAPGNGTALVGAPRWDHERRALFVGPRVVKRFRNPAPVQEAVLAAFEEEGWAPWIYDPLTPTPCGNPKQRVHNTIKELNLYQQPHLLRFKGDGTGTRIGWELG